MNAVVVRLLDFWAHEPAVITQAVTQAIVLLVAFGVPVTDEQRGAIVALVEAVGAIVSAVVIRSQVSSPATVALIEAGQTPGVKVTSFPPSPTAPGQPL